VRSIVPLAIISKASGRSETSVADIVYGGGRNEVTRFRWRTGEVENVTPIPLRGQHRVDRTEPVIFSPTDPHTLHYVADVVIHGKDLIVATHGRSFWILDASAVNATAAKFDAVMKRWEALAPR
jgi:hypothetical protein